MPSFSQPQIYLDCPLVSVYYSEDRNFGSLLWRLKRLRRCCYQEKTPYQIFRILRKKNFEPQTKKMVEGDCYPTVGGMCDVGWQWTRAQTPCKGYRAAAMWSSGAQGSVRDVTSLRTPESDQLKIAALTGLVRTFTRDRSGSSPGQIPLMLIWR